MFNVQWSMFFQSHEDESDDGPEEFADAADDGDEESEGTGHAECGDGECESTFAATELEGQESEYVGEERCEAEDEEALEESHGEGGEGVVGQGMEEDEHEEDLEALAYASDVFDGEAEVEGGARLTVELRYLTVDLGEVVVVVGEEPACPAPDARDAGEESYGAECHAVAVAPDEEVDAECTEECGEGKDDGDGCVEWQETEGGEKEVDDDGGCPEAEVGKDMHHGEEEYGGGGSLHSDMGCELDYLIGFAAEESDGCGVVECET